MEGKTLAEDDGKKELALGKILEIEKAYFDLMKAYSSCLTTLNVKARECYFNRFWLTPKIIRYRIGQHVTFLQEVFQSLIAQNRDKNDLKIIKKFELYSEDMNKLSVQVAESGLTTLFYNTSGAIGVIISALISLLTFVSAFNAALWIITLISWFLFLVLFLFSVCIVSGIRKSNRVLRKTGVQEKQEKIFALIQEYLEFE